MYEVFISFCVKTTFEQLPQTMAITTSNTTYGAKLRMKHIDPWNIGHMLYDSSWRTDIFNCVLKLIICHAIIKTNKFGNETRNKEVKTKHIHFDPEILPLKCKHIDLLRFLASFSLNSNIGSLSMNVVCGLEWWQHFKLALCTNRTSFFPQWPYNKELIL